MVMLYAEHTAHKGYVASVVQVYRQPSSRHKGGCTHSQALYDMKAFGTCSRVVHTIKQHVVV
jgi:hypothetical protein